MARTRTQFGYESFNPQGIGASYAKSVTQLNAAITEAREQNGGLMGDGPWKIHQAESEDLDNQALLLIGCELRQLNTLIECQYLHQTRHTRRWEAFCDDVAARLQRLRAWRPRPRRWFQVVPSGT